MLVANGAYTHQWGLSCPLYYVYTHALFKYKAKVVYYFVETHIGQSGPAFDPRFICLSTVFSLNTIFFFFK